MITFEAEAHHNGYLPIGGTEVDAIISVTASGSGLTVTTNAPTTAVVVVIDTSGSMQPDRKLHFAREAARAAIECLRDGVYFGVVAGAADAALVYPPGGELVPASISTRHDASVALDRLVADGGTAMGRWLMEAYHLLRPFDGAIRQVILLTDGQNTHEAPEYLRAVLDQCEGVFQCDCRGVGTDWRVDELREVATRLLGTVDLIARPDMMPADFATIVESTMAKGAADVRLRVWVPLDATIRFVKQVSPTIIDLTPQGKPIDDRTLEFPTGAWADESRDYHVRLSVPPQRTGETLRAGRASVAVGDDVVLQTPIHVEWTDDPVTATRINAHVAHYTNQVELASAIADGMGAMSAGDERTATVLLGRAAQLAAASNHHDTMRLLGQVVDVIDADRGTVRLRPKVEAVDAMALDTRSTRTVRTGTQA